MHIRAYGFSIKPSKHVAAIDLIQSLKEKNDKRKNIGGKYRLFAFSDCADTNGFYRVGILSIRDEKIALALVDDGKEISIEPRELDEEHLDFNIILLRIGKDGLIRGLATVYHGAASLRLFETRLVMANRKALRDAIKEVLAKHPADISVTDFIKTNGLEETFEFRRMVDKASFQDLVAQLDEIRRIDMKYETYKLKGESDQLLDKDIELIKKHEVIKLKAARHGKLLAKSIEKLLEEKNPKRATVIGILRGEEQSIDMHENPDSFWEMDLDKAKNEIKIKLSDFVTIPLFNNLSDEFKNDKRLLP